MPTELGQRIRRLRLEKGLTLEELARRADTSKTYIWQLENRPKTPSLKKLEQIARSLEVSPDLLLRDSCAGGDEDLDLAFLDRYRQLSPAKRRKVRRLVDIIFEN